MKRKQLGIIFTLLALILCVGVLAAKLNTGGLNDPTDLSAVLSTENVGVTDKNGEIANAEGEQATLSQQECFYQSKSEREQNDSVTIQNLKAIRDDQNTSQERKDEATKELTQKTMNQDKQSRIELNVKNKGYEDVLCMLDNNKATVIVKSENQLAEKDSVAIQEIVQNVSNIKDVIIQVEK